MRVMFRRPASFHAGPMTTRPKVVVAHTLPDAGLALLEQRFEVEAGGDRPEPGWLRAHAAGAAALVADPSVRVDADLLDMVGRSLRVVANFGVGYDNIDVDAVRARGLRATNTPDVLTNATAELAVALMLAAARRIVEADATVRADRWSGSADSAFLGRELAGATVGLVGFGRIARRVATLLRGFEVRLIAYSRSQGDAADGVGFRELAGLLAASDFVSVHVALTPETRHLIGAQALALMKRGAILVNTSRGAVVDTGALIDALRSGRLAAAGLDVYEDEPDVPAELRELPKTVLLPHIGSATASARDAMARLCAENVIAVMEGREPPAPVV
jgi:glyoxylate reductase